MTVNKHDAFIMIKSAFAILAALTLGAAGAQAAEVGIRHSAGSSHRAITNGYSEYSYNGRSETTTRTRSRSVSEHGSLGGEAGFCPPGQSECGGPSAQNPANFDGASSGGGFDRARNRSRTRTVTTDNFNYEGLERNNFAGGDNSVFSESSIFAN